MAMIQPTLTLHRTKNAPLIDAMMEWGQRNKANADIKTRRYILHEES